MEDTFSRSLLSAFVSAFIAESHRLARRRGVDDSRFFQYHIGHAVLDTESERNAKIHFSQMLRPHSRQRIRAEHVERALAECRRLLRNQLRGLSVRSPDLELARIERDICSSLRLKGAVASVDDFRQARLLETAKSPEDFGFVDVIAWRDGTMGFVERLRQHQDRSLVVLQELTTQIAIITDIRRKIELMHAALAIASINHPGSRHHTAITDLALQAEAAAGLTRLANSPSTPEDVRERAAFLNYHLHQLFVLPTLDSPFNCMRLALANTRLDSQKCAAATMHLDQIIAWASYRAWANPSDTRAIRERSSALSSKARLYLATGNRGLQREADRLHKESLVGIERLSQPYGLLYPIYNDVLKKDHRNALRRCEESIALCLSREDHSSAGAFAALFVHLSAVHSGSPTSRKWVRDIARTAVSSPSACYQFSHVFEARPVSRLLRGLG